MLRACPACCKWASRPWRTSTSSFSTNSALSAPSPSTAFSATRRVRYLPSASRRLVVLTRGLTARLFGATLDVPLSENAESTATFTIACKEQSRMAAQEAVAKTALEGGIAEQLPTIGPGEMLERPEQLNTEGSRSAEEAGDTERSWEAYGGGDGEALAKLRSECAKWLGDNEEVLPQYKVVEQGT